MTPKSLLPALVLAAAASAAFAKLPAADDAAKAKAAEAAARTGWQAKVDTYQLCKVQDRIASRYGDKSHAAKAPATAASAAVVKTAAAPATAASAPASASAAAPAGEKPTPVAAAGTPPPPCQDPGPFSYNQPQQTPLETSGAHSPAGTAVNPPSVRPESGTMTPGKK